ncbi:Tripartite motif-containing protein 47 [Channa argus]|uniref:Tripartite motif-containing protein 47 n=1 Tax=Channa argus TaxID=215402 RepID=A0A6G1PNC2_CHAAH|nr:Tripartite motif-containing protein 47 [Channa argus]
MASASGFLCEDQFLCSICLDVFMEPLSIPCGHNFCKSCITRHWEGKEKCQCPLCNSTFNKGLNLCINTAFREVVENFKKHRKETSCDNNSFLAKPGEVPCDCCLDKKVKASKTCLVCLTSFCELHLQPHQRVDALKRHQLTEPVLNLEDKICKTHNRVLELFCRNDLTCICVLCTDHSAHDTVPLDKAYVNKKVQIGKKKAEQTSRKRAQKMKAPVQTVKKDKNDGTPKSLASLQTQGSHIWWFPNEGSHIFHKYSYVPGNSSFSEDGFCYEIQVNSNWDLGVVIESKRGKSTLLPIHGNGMGIIRLARNSNGKALQNDPVHLYLIKNLREC